jgi:hypothetical protein
MTKQSRSHQPSPLRAGERASVQGSERAGVSQSPPAYGIEFADTPRVARAGVRGSGGRLPYFETIQRAFGRHDIGHVQSYMGPAASSACRSIGARAYTTGNRVAFDGPPSLHTAAHEAAHAIQQHAGVQLEGGVGRAGDRYEQEADAVADAVVRGASAEALLDARTPTASASSTSSSAPVQCKLITRTPTNQSTQVNPGQLIGAIEGELPASFTTFLPTLSESGTDHVFATGDNGKVTEKTAKDVIAGTKESFVVSGGFWSFFLPDEGWQHMDHVSRTVGASALKHGDVHAVTMPLAYLPQVTQKVLDSVKALDVAARTPTVTMALKTDLAYQSHARNAGQVKEYGTLGNVVLSVTPNMEDSGAAATVQAIKEWVIETFTAWEPMQMDPRHIGTHDGYNMGTVWHYHLIMPPGTTLSDNDKTTISQKMTQLGAFQESAKEREKREKAEQQAAKESQMDPDEKAMRAFLAAAGLSKDDANKQALIRKAFLKGIPAAVAKWVEVRDKVTWKPKS